MHLRSAEWSEAMRKRARNSLILIVVLVVILGLGFGVYKIFVVPAEPLKIKDLEDAHITITRSAEEHGWVYVFRDYTSSVFFNEEGNGHFDNQNIFHDGNSSKTALALMIEAYGDACAITVQAGDTLEITYDGGRRLLVYLPRITQENLTLQKWGGYGFVLYVASDGSTYYDERLIQLAQSVPLKPNKEAKNE